MPTCSSFAMPTPGCRSRTGFSETGDCATFDQGISDPADGIARGYITVDNVKTCSTYTATFGCDLLRKRRRSRRHQERYGCQRALG